MSLILSLETASVACSIALHNNDELLGERISNEPQSASSQLAVMIKDLLGELDVKPGMLSAVTVSSGPGSYTGLRIGVATAKGLCFGHNTPLVAINTLELMAFQVSQSVKDAQTLLCPMLDARRMEVYCLLADSQLRILEPTDAKVIDKDSFMSWLSKSGILFFGNGAEKCREVITHENAKFLNGVVPQASALGVMAYQKFLKNEFEDVSSFEPHYLKEFMIKKLKPA